jgi:hypothetical protein
MRDEQTRDSESSLAMLSPRPDPALTTAPPRVTHWSGRVAMYVLWMVAIGLVNFCERALLGTAVGSALGLVVLDQFGPSRIGVYLLAGMGVLATVSAIGVRRWILLERQRRYEAQAGTLFETLRADRHAAVAPFFVYIRSFETTGQLKPPLFYSLTLSQNLQANELESFLALALRRAGLLVALGDPGENLGAARVGLREQQWHQEVITLLHRSRGVLVVPSHREGTRWEVSYLREHGLLSKCVFVMPPHTRRFDWQHRWEEAREALQGCGVSLPPYYKRGLLFTLDDEGAAANASPFPLTWRWILRRCILRLLRRQRQGRGGPTRLARAVFKSRLLWLFYRGPVTVVALLLITLVALSAVAPIVRPGPEPLPQPPPWSRFADRVGVGLKLEDNAQGLSRIELAVRSRLNRRRAEDLERLGLPHLSDDQLLFYFNNLAQALFDTDDRTCGQLVLRADKLSVMRTRVNVPLDAADRFLDFSRFAAEYAVSHESRPPSPDLPGDVYAAVHAVVGPAAAARLRAIAERQPASEADACWAERTLLGACARLRAPYDRRWARELATRRAAVPAGYYSFVRSGFERAGMP